MLSKYQKRINDLEANNQELNIKFQKAYDLLSKIKKKKLDKILLQQ
tara:strand:- start:147 stop:284 length:138 start_codon:yes stop_codon:yes gene_type:complete